MGSSKTGDLLHSAQPKIKHQQYVTKWICAQKPQMIACEVLKPWTLNSDLLNLQLFQGFLVESVPHDTGWRLHYKICIEFLSMCDDTLPFIGSRINVLNHIHGCQTYPSGIKLSWVDITSLLMPMIFRHKSYLPSTIKIQVKRCMSPQWNHS